jgi:Ca-activated chloride channel family protein
MNVSRPTIAKFAALLALAFTLLAGGLFLLTRSDSPAARLLRQGNQAFADGRFIDALGLYQLVQNRFPELGEPFYNAANALYRQESYADAIAQLDQALQTSAEGDLAQSSQYNKGNAAYTSQDLETAVQAYIAALLLNPDDADAKYNLELALQQQQQEQQEQQEQEQQEQQEQESSSDGESQEDPQNSDQQDQSQDGQAEQPQDQSENGDQDSDQQSDQSQDGQEQNQDGQGEDGEPQENEPPQPGQGQPQPGDPTDSQPNGMVPQPGERLTSEQARQLLAAIAQGSGTLQERLQQMFVSPRPPSAQDW